MGIEVGLKKGKESFPKSDTNAIRWESSDEENLKRCIEAIPTRWTTEDGTPLRDWLRSITSCFNSTGIVEAKLTTW